MHPQKRLALTGFVVSALVSIAGALLDSATGVLVATVMWWLALALYWFSPLPK